ncbi:glycosyltransferase family 4 protein [Streptomyces sp. NPDC059101]|uniref:glycosyltransferase family 4 protein n=1 Tax=Streptomyces sp. NPDC059101 TaxID=3346728 RepID=UPI00367B4AAF
MRHTVAQHDPSLLRARRAGAPAEPPPAKIAVAMHDGFYGCTSGTGFSNRAFLEALVQALPPGLLLVIPVQVSRSDPSYDPAWTAETELILHRAQAHVVPVPGGRALTGYLAGCAALCAQVMDVAREHLAHAPNAELIGLDIPFLGLGGHYNARDPFSLLLLPRSTTELTSPQQQRRIEWERRGMESAVRSGARIAAISDHMAAHLKRVYGVPQRALVEIPNGLNPATPRSTPPTTPLPQPAQDGFLLAMGRAVASKGFEDLLEAVRLLNAERSRVPHLLLAPTSHGLSPNDYQRRLRALMRHHRIDGTFVTRFSPGYRSWLESPALRAVIVPSRAEPFGRIPLEAFAAGAAPVVATRAGGLTETVVDGVTGFTARPSDPVSLAAAMKRALRITAREREQLRDRGKALLAARHDYEATIRTYLHTYIPWSMNPNSVDAESA